MSTSRRQKDDADDDIEAMFAGAEAELNATLNESIEDIGRLDNRQLSEDYLGTPAGATTKAPAVRTSCGHISRHDEYKDNDNDDNGAEDVGDYSSFDDNDNDELSLDGEIENLEGLAMEDLARELRDLDSMLTVMENNGDGDIGTCRQETTTRPAPFEGKGRRARARRARIKREMKAREERATAKANDLRGGKGEKYSKQEVKKPLKSLGSTSSLGRALAASQAKSSSKFDNKQGASRPSGQGVISRAEKGETETNPSINSVERSLPFQGKGRRARARRAKERREKVAEQVETAESSGTGDAIVYENGEKHKEAVQMQTVTGRSTHTGTKREVDLENISVVEVLKSKTFPDFSIREALS